MLSAEKLKQLAQRLLEHTSEKKIEWEPLDEADNEFTADIGGRAVRVRQTFGEDDDDKPLRVYLLSVLDGHKRVVEETESTVKYPFGALFDAARSSALGGESVVDDLLKELK